MPGLSSTCPHQPFPVCESARAATHPAQPTTADLTGRRLPLVPAGAAHGQWGMARTPQRPRRTGIAAYLPLVVGICAILVARRLMGAIAPGLNLVVAFVLALVVGYVAYWATERELDRRYPPRGDRGDRGERGGDRP